eukprot:442585-Pleurochrysis_carterae.AAC.1
MASSAVALSSSVHVNEQRRCKHASRGWLRRRRKVRGKFVLQVAFFCIGNQACLFVEEQAASRTGVHLNAAEEQPHRISYATLDEFDVTGLAHHDGARRANFLGRVDAD